MKYIIRLPYENTHREFELDKPEPGFLWALSAKDAQPFQTPIDSEDDYRFILREIK